MTGNGDGIIRVWELLTGELLAATSGQHSEFVQVLALSRDRRFLVSGANDNEMKIWDC